MKNFTALLLLTKIASNMKNLIYYATIFLLSSCIPESKTNIPEPTPGQQAMIERKYGMFLHYGMNTYLNAEWSDGTAAPSTYNPPADIESKAAQWVKNAKTAGMRSGVAFNEISMNGNASFVKGGLLENEDGTQTELVNAEQFYLLEMKLKVSCDYEQLWNFLKECEESGFYVTADHIAITSNKTESGKLEGDLQLNYYSIVSSEMAQAAAGE